MFFLNLGVKGFCRSSLVANREAARRLIVERFLRWIYDPYNCANTALANPLARIFSTSVTLFHSANGFTGFTTGA